MGGNALKHCNTRRYERGEYLELEQQVLAKLRALFPGCRLEAIRAYRSKPSFGDMDLLLATDASFDAELAASGLLTLNELLRHHFHSAEVVQNSNCYSFEHQQFQIDLILMPAADFEPARHYFAWNDLGNLMGRIAHKLGLKYGHDGLWCVLREDTFQFDELLVSRDIDAIAAFLGYDPVRLQAGFDTLEEMYAFAASSPFFNAEIFAFHNRNHANRVRDNKRASYNGFLQWLDGQTGLPAYPWQSFEDRGGRVLDSEHQQRAFAHFPGFAAEHAAAMIRFDEHRQAKRIFNGEQVSAWSGLQGVELGRLMRPLKEALQQRAEQAGCSLDQIIISLGSSAVQALAEHIRGQL